MTKGIVYGVGINDSPTPVRKTETINGKVVEIWACPFYKVWVQILVRCYSEAYRKKYKYEYSPKVCDEWLRFSNFKSWMDKQDWVGKQLDKDILVSGNKEYSPSTCVFVDQHLNKFFNLHKNRKSDTLIGVSRNSRGSRFGSCITRGGKTCSLGGFSTELEAHHAWLREKIVDIGKFICEDGSALDNRLKEIQSCMKKCIEDNEVFNNF